MGVGIWTCSLVCYRLQVSSYSFQVHLRTNLLDERPAAKFEWIARPVAEKEKKHKKRGPESPPFISHGVLHSFHRLTTFLTTLTPRSKLIFTRYVPEG